MPICEDIRQRYPDLPAALQQVARFILEHPGEVVTSSMRGLGMRADSAPATLVRFAQSLGFEGWPQLKQAFAQDLGLAQDKAYGSKALALLQRASHEDLAAENFAQQQRNLETTLHNLGDKLQHACGLLEQAASVHVAGFRASFAVAFSFVYLYRLLRPSVHLMDGHGGTLEMQCRALSAGDSLLVMGFAPYSREALMAAQAAQAAGCRIVALTDSPASPLALLADVTLLFSLHSQSFFPSTTAAMALSEALAEMLASRAGQDVVARIDQAEAQLFHSGAYLQRPRPRSSRPGPRKEEG
ncbi:MurR/RpiR family transcriptional regulator [Comamonas composti]|uniref:MurR/RpiR family transcriptional regulator n=1 Tax=Comamonas composti TaxID=408558 RepID=UPI00047DEE16|nr:MurR/RpiR family transcriptional regulator [Comamonas composti]